MVVESLRTSHVTRGVPAFLTSAVSQNKNELTDPNYLDDTVTPVPAAPQLSTVITPTISEAGLPGFNVMQWSGLFAPAGTPQSVVTKLNQEINDILMKPDIKERLVRIGVEPSGGSPAEFSTFIAEEVKKWANVIDKANISLN